MLYRTLENYDDSAVSHTIEPSCVGYFPQCDTTDEQTCNAPPAKAVGCKWGVGACGGSSTICPLYTNRTDCGNAIVSHGCGWGVPSCSGPGTRDPWVARGSQCDQYLFEDTCNAPGNTPLKCKWGVPTCSGSSSECNNYLFEDQCTSSLSSLGCKWGVNQ